MGELLSAWFPGGSALTWPDYAAVAAVAAAMVVLGRRAAGRTATAADYFLAGRGEHWAVAGLALVAAEVSALTVLGVPASSFRGDWSFLQVFAGAAAARALVALVFLPAFFKDHVETPYSYLGRRFGPRTRAAGALAFLVTRVLLSSVRLLAACVAAGYLLGWGVWPVLVLLTALSVAALARGGARAAVWTGAFQAAVIGVVGALTLLFLLRRVDGGIGGAWSLAAEAGKTRILTGPASLGAALLVGFFGSAASFGTDQEMTQKLLVVKNARRGRGAMLLSVVGSLGVLGLYLAAGTLLFVFYKQNPGMALPDTADMLYPHFTAKMMGSAMRGLVLAAILLASADAPLASLASVFVVDVKRPFSRRAPTDAEELGLARGAAWAFALLLAVLAGLFASFPDVLALAFKAGGVAAGPTLGVFLLGLTSDRRGDGPVLAAFGVFCGLDLALLTLSELGLLPAEWSAFVALGAVGTYALAWFFTRPRRAAPSPAR